jgi:hypothetical protein
MWTPLAALMYWAGKMENYEMAKRFKAAYPNLLAGKYNSDIIFLRATQEQRYLIEHYSCTHVYTHT